MPKARSFMGITLLHKNQAEGKSEKQKKLKGIMLT